MSINVEPTAEIIDTAAKRLVQASETLIRISTKMREKNDITYSAEALSEILNVLQCTRLDLLVTRPIRAFQSEMENKHE